MIIDGLRCTMYGETELLHWTKSVVTQDPARAKEHKDPNADARPKLVEMTECNLFFYLKSLTCFTNYGEVPIRVVTIGSTRLALLEAGRLGC
jgi:hypothetical protein